MTSRVGLFMRILDSTIVNTALPAMATSSDFADNQAAIPFDFPGFLILAIGMVTVTVELDGLAAWNIWR